jgi:hypothetical protein
MPAAYEGYPCEVCGDSHTLYFPGGRVPDLSKPFYFTCPTLPVAMRVTRGGSVEAGEREAGRGNQGESRNGAQHQKHGPVRKAVRPNPHRPRVAPSAGLRAREDSLSLSPERVSIMSSI